MYIMKIYIIVTMFYDKTHMEFQLNMPKPSTKIVTIRKPSQILDPCGSSISVLDDETTTFFGVPQVFPLWLTNCEKIKKF